ncbi:MAG: rubrerythrin family protein [Gammaproteobacteria bacterium]|nr:rubrerythrin family protein [Gammaproteobacteria bacterium]
MKLSPVNKLPADVHRRQFLAAGAFAIISPLAVWSLSPAAALTGYTKTISALKRGVMAETAAHRRYVLFARLAKADGYKGLAYLYMALADSELIHAENYNRILVKLGEFPVEPEIRGIPAGNAKENLIFAAEREVDSIEKTYPTLLKSMGSEGYHDAISVIRYSWSSHKQHRDIIKRIRRWSPSAFEMVARKIDEKTDRYYICRICGSTVTRLPREACPVCGEPPLSYRLVSPDQFL